MTPRDALSALRDAAAIYLVAMASIVWLAYLTFYAEIGIAPGEVGFGFGQALERSAGALPYILILWVTTLAIVELGIFLLACSGVCDSVTRIWTPRDGAEPGDGKWMSSRRWRLIYIPPMLWVAVDDRRTAAVGFFLAIMLMLPWGTRIDRRLARDLLIGATVTSVVLGAVVLSLAEAARQSASSAASPRRSGTSRS